MSDDVRQRRTALRGTDQGKERERWSFGWGGARSNYPDLGAFLDEEVLPRLFDNLPSAFPEFGWVRDGRGWKATDYAHCKKTLGARDGRVVCHEPFGLLVHGADPLPWAKYVLGRGCGEPYPNGEEWVEAVRRLAERAGVPFPEGAGSAKANERARKRQVRRTALETLRDHAAAALQEPCGQQALTFLAARGLTASAVKDFAVGYYDSAERVREACHRGGLSAEEIAEAHIVDPKLEGYVLFPWPDRHGRLVTFTGRWAEQEVPRGRTKYRHLTGTNKDSPLYLDRALKARHRTVVLSEGVFDATVAQSRGLTEVISPAGTEIPEGTPGLLARAGVEEVVVALDSDDPGRAKVGPAVKGLCAAGLRTRVLSLPEGTDLDELLLRECGLDDYRRLREGAVSGPVWLAARALGEVTPDSSFPDKEAAVDRVARFVEAELSGPKADLYAAEAVRLVGERTGLSPEALEPLFEAARDRGAREAQGRALREALEDAGRRSRQGDHPEEVARDLVEGLAGALPELAEEPPPEFCVDRLVESVRALPQGRPSGWPALDAQEVRFVPGEFALAAARTGHGKTSLLTGLALNWLLDNSRDGDDDRLLIYSHEESEAAIFLRLAALLTARLHRDQKDRRSLAWWSVAQIRTHLRDGAARHGPDRETLDAAFDRLRALQGRLQIVYRPHWRAGQIAAHARQAARDRPVGGLFLDYLQRVPADGDARRDLHISGVGRALKHLAVDLACPVVAGCQVNREAVRDREAVKGSLNDREVRDRLAAFRPQLHQLREGGSEQEADLVLGLHNPRADLAEDQTPERHSEPLDVGVLKNRYGAAGRWVELTFTPAHGLIEGECRDEYAF